MTLKKFCISIKFGVISKNYSAFVIVYNESWPKELKIFQQVQQL
jgi:hypothetical protein